MWWYLVSPVSDYVPTSICNYGYISGRLRKPMHHLQNMLAQDPLHTTHCFNRASNKTIFSLHNSPYGVLHNCSYEVVWFQSGQSYGYADKLMKHWFSWTRFWTHSSIIQCFFWMKGVVIPLTWSLQRNLFIGRYSVDLDGILNTEKPTSKCSTFYMTSSLC